MLRVEVSGVWKRTSDGLIIPRAGASEVGFETPNSFENDHDFAVPILISEGLLASDAVIRVIAQPRNEGSDAESVEEILLVGSYGHDGSGVVLSSSAILREPNVNTTDHMRKIWRNLAPTSLTLESFDLNHLAEYIHPLVAGNT